MPARVQGSSPVVATPSTQPAAPKPVATPAAAPATGWAPKAASPRADPNVEPGFDNKYAPQARWAQASGNLFVNGVSADDPIQGALGDCYAVSGFAALANVNPKAIEDAIKDNGDGTFTVRFFKESLLGLVGRGQEPTYVTVDAKMPTKDGQNPLYARGRDTKELWPMILEKAYAKFDGSYQSAGKGGSPCTVWQALTGRSGSMTPNALRGEGLFEQMKSNLASGKPVAATTTMALTKAVQAQGLVPGHVYAVLGVSDVNGEQRVQLRNPWGNTEPGADGKNDGLFSMSFADFKQHFGLTFLGN